jgi:hypothetical protein
LRLPHPHMPGMTRHLERLLSEGQGAQKDPKEPADFMPILAGAPRKGLPGATAPRPC